MSTPDWLSDYAKQQGWDAPQPDPKDVSDLQAYADTFGQDMPQGPAVGGGDAASDNAGPLAQTFTEKNKSSTPTPKRLKELSEDLSDLKRSPVTASNLMGVDLSKEKTATTGGVPDWMSGGQPTGVDPSAGDAKLDATLQQMQTKPGAMTPLPVDAKPLMGDGTHGSQTGAPASYTTAQTEPKKINFATPSANAAPAATPGGPLNIPAAHIVGGGWGRTISPEALETMNTITADKLKHANSAGQAALNANDLYQQEYQRQVAANQAQQDAAKQEQTRQRIARDKAQEDYDHAQKLATAAKIEPNRLFKDAGATIFAALGSALGAFGASLNHTPNFAQEAINKAIDNDMEAQKLEYNGKKEAATNAWADLKAKTGSAEQADNAFRLAGLEVAKSKLAELGAGAQGAAIAAGLDNQMDTIRAQGLQQRLATEGRIAPQQIGGITAADIKRSREIRDEAAKGGKDMDPTESMRQALAERMVPQTGGFQSYAKVTGRDANAHSRALGTMAAYQKAINESNEGERSVDEMIKMVKAGGQMDKARTKRGAFLRDSSINSMATIMANGAKPGDKEIDMATHMHPEDPNSYQYTGADLAQLEAAKAWFARKREANEASMKQLHDDPFSAPADANDVAAAAGATKD